MLIIKLTSFLIIRHVRLSPSMKPFPNITTRVVSLEMLVFISWPFPSILGGSVTLNAQSAPVNPVLQMHTPTKKKEEKNQI